MQQSKQAFWEKFDHPGKRPIPMFLFHFLVKPLMWIRYRVRVEGLDHIPTEGPLLVLTKHQRYEDIPLGYLFVLAKRRRDVWCLMKHTLGGGVLTRLGGISINRMDPRKSKKELQMCKAVLDSGCLLNLFPEQTLHPGKMARGKLPGFRFITDRPDGPIAKVISLGFKYGRKSFLRRRHVTICVGVARSFHPDQDHVADFFYQRMLELAELCQLSYDFPSFAMDKKIE